MPHSLCLMLIFIVSAGGSVWSPFSRPVFVFGYKPAVRVEVFFVRCFHFLQNHPASTFLSSVMVAPGIQMLFCLKVKPSKHVRQT